MKFVKAYIADSAHLLHPDHTPRAVYLCIDEGAGGEVPEPPKVVREVGADPVADELAKLRAQVAALEAAKAAPALKPEQT